jgi:hypothetical protein
MILLLCADREVGVGAGTDQSPDATVVQARVDGREKKDTFAFDGELLGKEHRALHDRMMALEDLTVLSCDNQTTVGCGCGTWDSLLEVSGWTKDLCTHGAKSVPRMRSGE